MYKLDPSYKSASALSNYYAIRSDFLMQSVSSGGYSKSESGDVEDGSFLMEISTYYAKMDQYVKAAEAAREAMQRIQRLPVRHI